MSRQVRLNHCHSAAASSTVSLGFLFFVFFSGGGLSWAVL